ncbi:LOW QUALITY PROTEIN: hypothetical protein V2J09_017800 [Rumex salicifolius]
MRALNLAFIAKLNWHFLKQNDSFWAKILIAKYIRPAGHTVQNTSYVWKGVQKGVQMVIMKGTRWLFWLDPCLTQEPLRNEMIGALDSMTKNAMVCDYWKESGGWDWSSISNLLSPSTLLKLAAVAIRQNEGARDVLSWGRTTNGEFSIASAYIFPWNDISFFDAIWKFKVPERIRTFVWLAARGCILTNEERRRRHLTDVVTCPICKTELESLSHLFRDCPKILEKWKNFGSLPNNQYFFTEPFACWIRGNIHSFRGDWGLVCDFATSLWWTWRTGMRSSLMAQIILPWVRNLSSNKLGSIVLLGLKLFIKDHVRGKSKLKLDGRNLNIPSSSSTRMGLSIEIPMPLLGVS